LLAVGHTRRVIELALASEPELWDYLQGLKQNLGLETDAAAARTAIRAAMTALPMEGAKAQLLREALNECRRWFYKKAQEFGDRLQEEMKNWS
jgi:hypothetical protein